MFALSTQADDYRPGYSMSAISFLEWLSLSKPGDNCIYFVGYLGDHDADVTVRLVALKNAGYMFKRRKHESSGDTKTWQLVNKPLIDLVQKRLGAVT